MIISDIPDGWKYIFSSLIGGGIAIIVTFLNNRYQLRKDAKTWEKEKLWEGYQKCISSLNLIQRLTREVNEEGREVFVSSIERQKAFALYSEIRPYLYWIIYNYPNPPEVGTLEEIFVKSFSFNNVDDVIREITKLMLKDPRLSNRNREIDQFSYGDIFLE